VALTAELERDGDRLLVNLANTGDAPLTFSASAMAGTPAFEVVDADGGPVPLGPPPTPPADLREGLVTLQPGEALCLVQDLMALLPGGPDGARRVRFAGTAPPLPGVWSGKVLSPWIEV